MWRGVHCLLCRPNRPLPNPVYEEYEYMGGGSGGVVLANMTKNPSYVTTGEAVTSFSSGTADRDKDHTYEVLPFEAAEEEQEAADGGQGVATDDVHVYVNQ